VLLKGWRFEIFAKPTSLPANQSGGSSALSEHPADDDRCRRPLAVPDPISNRRHATSSGVWYVEGRPSNLRRSPSTTIGAPRLPALARSLVEASGHRAEQLFFSSAAATDESCPL